jgi:hypothetical protein
VPTSPHWRSLRGLLAGATALLLVGCRVLELAPNVVPKNLPQVPDRAELDHEPLPGMAHAAFPRFDIERGQFTGPARVWLKGSPACREAHFGERRRTVVLEPPYHTAVVDIEPEDLPPGPPTNGAVTVQFVADGEPVRTLAVAPPDAVRLNAPQPASSALFVGDFQPFHVIAGGVAVNPGEPMQRRSGAPSTLVAMRQLLQATAEGRIDGIPKPSWLCGVGDQIYVEGDYHAFGKLQQRHPMSAWTVEAQPRPRVAASELPRFLDTMYRAHWSFPSLERALQALPSVMTWDDHEIRDGWGSQGDEHVYRDSHFRHFRAAYVEHQVRRGPRALGTAAADPQAALWQQLTWHGVPVFVMDQRTCRDITAPSILGDEQWQALRAWFTNLQASRSRYYVLVSSVPIFYRIADRANLAAKLQDEARDDLLDTWTAAPNRAEWQRLVDEITAAGARGLRGLIVSGDYHVNSLCRVTRSNGSAAPTVLAYEMIAAGLAADHYGDWKQKIARDGWLLETPIATRGGEVSTELAFLPPCPSFLSLSLVDERAAVTWWRAEAKGCSRLEAELDWDVPLPGVRTLLRRAPTTIDLDVVMPAAAPAPRTKPG